MTTPEPNEAAERLRRFLGMERREELHDLALHDLLDAALAAERVATTTGMLDAIQQASDAAHAAERRATVAIVRGGLEGIADDLDTRGMGLAADILRTRWRSISDAILDAEAER